MPKTSFVKPEYQKCKTTGFTYRNMFYLEQKEEQQSELLKCKCTVRQHLKHPQNFFSSLVVFQTAFPLRNHVLLQLLKNLLSVAIQPSPLIYLPVTN